MEKNEYKIILFYKFTKILNPEGFRDEQKALCESLNLKGRMLIAPEGINATFEGKVVDIDTYIKKLKEDSRFGDIIFKESEGNGIAFPKLKVKVRKEIVTLGAGEFNIAKETAKEITADELQKLYEKNEDFVVLDLRNDYEINAGRFDKTVHPNIKNFRDLPEKLPELESLKDKKVVTVCTGGIRCEKATCLMNKVGFTNIYQLKDGIHTYMAKYPNEHFKGTLFVFDNRILTDVVETPNREVVGECTYCGLKCEDFYNDDTVKPSKKLICCPNCAFKNKTILRKIVS